MYNIYKNGVKVAQTTDKTYIAGGLQPGTEYTLGVSKVDGDKESDIVEVKGRTLEREESVEDSAEGVEGEATTLFTNETEEQPTDDLNDVSAYHIGGGYYELPNGEKVRGKEAATKALNELA